VSEKPPETKPAKIEKTEKSVVEKGGYSSSNRRSSELPPPPPSMFNRSADQPQSTGPDPGRGGGGAGNTSVRPPRVVTDSDKTVQE
jgi:hypothetical protein